MAHSVYGLHGGREGLVLRTYMKDPGVGSGSRSTKELVHEVAKKDEGTH